ncbi:MAG: glycosyltransferase family 2 protein [Vicinamibacterales bacterium]
MTPKVSVVIPVLNRPVAVRRAIESVLTQTLQDFEIIVVDDGSTDETAAAVQAFADPRIRLTRHERPRGGSAARNTGIRASSAPYVAFLDSDDEWLPTKLERQLEVFERSDEDLALVYTGAEWVYPLGTVRTVIPRRYADLARRLLTSNIVGETSVGMVRRTALNEIGGFDESLPSCQDMDLWLRICERFHADVVSEALVRVTKGNDSGRITNNVADAVRGRALFCHKHRKKLIHHGVLHLYLRKSGWWQQRRVRDRRLARRMYLQSLRANPVAPVTYVLLLTAYMPVPWVNMMAQCKRFVIRFLRLGPEPYVAVHPYRLASMAKLLRNRPKDPATS